MDFSYTTPHRYYNEFMVTPILATKLFIPPPRPSIVTRRRLFERLDEGLHHKLILVSAPAGFGKTTLVSEWLAGCGQLVAWLSLDEGDNDPVRFLTHLVAALETVPAGLSAGARTGQAAIVAIQAAQLPPYRTAANSAYQSTCRRSTGFRPCTG